jgi:Calx-beta domain
MSSTRCTLPVVGLIVLAGAAIAAVPTAGGTALALGRGKPLIGQPVTMPVRPLAGKPFAASFKVMRSDTGAPLTSGTMTAVPSVSGRAVPHTQSFRGGTARLSLVVPATAAGKSLRIALTIKAGAQSATKIATFPVLQRATTPSLTIGDASVLEGNSGSATLLFPVTLSAASTQAVSVNYATFDGTAAAPGDYAAASATITFAPGERSKTIAVSVAGDTTIEGDETLTMTISNPSNATVADGTATGTITNDDVTPAPAQITPGSYKGATQEGNYVFFTVRPDRTITGFRANDLPESCDPGGSLTGGVNWGDIVFPIASDANFVREERWSGSDVTGDLEWTAWYAKITGRFTGTTVAGTIVTSSEVNYQGTHYKCSTTELKWSAALQN